MGNREFSHYYHSDRMTSSDSKDLNIFSDHIPEKTEPSIIPEMSDEEIQQYADIELKSDITRWFFIEGAKWYREQLKKKV